MINEIELQKYPLISNVFRYLNKNYFLYSKTYEYILSSFNDKYLSFCEDLLSALHKKCKSEDNFENAIKAFIKYSHEYLLLQSKLEKEGKYLYSTFDEANKNVYQNERMNEYYLDGLLLSQVLWPNHYKMGQYLLQHTSLAGPSSMILNVPSGTGIYSYLIARYFKYKRLYSVDISIYSKSYTETLLQCSNLDTEKIAVETGDVFNLEYDREFDFVICDELLEHVEAPEDLLGRLSNFLKDTGAVFLTTAIYAAAIDHIYLFNNVSAVRALVNREFQIVSELILPVSLQKYKPHVNKVPLNYACILRNRIK